MNQRGKPIDDITQMPPNLSDEEQIKFLETHGISETFWEQTEPVPEDERPRSRHRTKQINVRFDDFTLRRLKEMAERRNVGYQTLLKNFVVERLYEEEKREGAFSSDEPVEAQGHQESTRRSSSTKDRDWQQEAFKFVKEHEEILEDDDLDFIVSASLLKDSTSLLRELSREIKSASAKKGFPLKKLGRMLKGYDRLKAFCDRAFEVHEKKFGLPDEEDEDDQGLRRSEEVLQAADDNVIDARERFAG